MNSFELNLHRKQLTFKLRFTKYVGGGEGEYNHTSVACLRNFWGSDGVYHHKSLIYASLYQGRAIEPMTALQAASV